LLTQQDLSVIIQTQKHLFVLKTHILWNTFFAVLNNIRPRLQYASSDTRIPNQQAVSCCHRTDAVTVLWHCVSYDSLP